MKLMKKMRYIFSILLAGCLLFSIPPTVQGFNAWTLKERDILLDKLDKPQWRIGYNFTVDCPAEFRQQEKQLQEAITKALQAWLQPLRERYPNKQFTDNFLLVRHPDVAACEEDRLSLRELDTRITFDCAEDARGAFARIALAGEAPDICMRKGVAVGVENRGFTFTLVHELGHAFGLGDTYVRDRLPSIGGLAYTMGKQPSAVMSSTLMRHIIEPFALGQDDKNGIIWLYKYLYENQPTGDCFFPDYIRVEWDGRCEPNYPLIFEAKHGVFQTVRQILIDDPTLELNARDSHGMTALHYAVQRGSAEMVEVLLAQAKIKVNLLNKDKLTPAQLARELRQVNLAKLIEAHPTAKHHPIAWSVSSKWRLTATWGAVKRKR